MQRQGYLETLSDLSPELRAAMRMEIGTSSPVSISIALTEREVVSHDALPESFNRGGRVGSLSTGICSRYSSAWHATGEDRGRKVAITYENT